MTAAAVQEPKKKTRKRKAKAEPVETNEAPPAVEPEAVPAVEATEPPEQKAAEAAEAPPGSEKPAAVAAADGQPKDPFKVRLRELQAEVERTEEEAEDAKEAYSIAKSAHTSAVGRRDKFIHDEMNPQETPLYQKDKKQDGEAQGADPSANGQAEPNDESWKDVKLAEALTSLSKSILQKLNDANLFTVGELANWTAEDGGRHRLVDISGIGVSAATKIENALDEFWSARATKAPAEAAPEAESQDLGDDPYSAVLTVELADLPLLKDRLPLLGALHLAGIKTVGSIIDRAAKEKKSIIDALRGCDLSIADADLVQDAIRERAKQADA